MEFDKTDKLIEYFIDYTNGRFDKLESKIDSLTEFRWLLVGIAAGISGVVSAIITIVGLIHK